MERGGLLLFFFRVVMFVYNQRVEPTTTTTACSLLIGLVQVPLISFFVQGKDEPYRFGLFDYKQVNILYTEM
jgi:sorbitol-specific phosphotransferase system component IIC